MSEVAKDYLWQPLKGSTITLQQGAVICDLLCNLTYLLGCHTLLYNKRGGCQFNWSQRSVYAALGRCIRAETVDNCTY